MASLLIYGKSQTCGFLPRLGIAQLLAFAHLLCLSLFAQERLLPVFHFQTLEGIRPEWVTSRVVPDSVGFIWIASGGINSICPPDHRYITLESTFPYFQS